MKENFSMRTHYGVLMKKFMVKNKRIVILGADTFGGTHVKFASEEFPRRSINFGISEQNMMAAAAGLASTNKIPIVNTYGMFASMRALEMLRTAICLNNANVKIVSSHCGLDVGQDGPTHQIIEDISILRSIPNLKILTPMDKYELHSQLDWMIKYNGPVYLRTIRRKQGEFYKKKTNFKIGEWPIIKKGKNVTIICLQVTYPYVERAAFILKNKYNISAQIIHASSLKPVNENSFLKKIRDTKLIVTVEDHNIYGGLGSIVSEILSTKMPKKLVRIGVKDRFGKSGAAEEIFKLYGISENNIVKTILKKIKK